MSDDPARSGDSGQLADGKVAGKESTDAGVRCGPDGLLLVLTNVGDAQAADRIALALVEDRLAACVNVLAACRSVYRWQGVVERADEVPLLIKTSIGAWPALSRRLRALHPYEVPEIVAWRPAAVDADYRAWALGEIAAEPGAS